MALEKLRCGDLIECIVEGVWLILFAMTNSMLSKTAVARTSYCLDIISYPESLHTCVVYLTRRCASLYQVIKLPQLRLYVDGVELGAVKGIPSKDDIEKLVRNYNG